MTLCLENLGEGNTQVYRSITMSSRLYGYVGERVSSYHPHSSILISLLHRYATQLPWFPFDVGKSMGENFYRLLIFEFICNFRNFWRILFP